MVRLLAAAAAAVCVRAGLATGESPAAPAPQAPVGDTAIMHDEGDTRKEIENMMKSLPEEVLKASTFPWKKTAAELKNFPDTAIPGADYLPDCNMAKCAGADRNYYMQAVIKDFVIKGSRHIMTAPPGTYPNLKSSHKISNEDVTLTTRTLEAIPGAPNSAFGPDLFGGDGTGGLLGPALLMLPGQSVNLFVKNNLDPAYQQGPPFVPSPEMYADKAGNLIQAGTRTIISTLGNVPDSELASKILGQFLPWKPESVENMHADRENMPGYTTNRSFNIFNIHLHGMEVDPHLFHPMGTSDPEAPWVEIQPTPDNGQQCYCYKFQVSPDNSKGLFAYHTHRHGTETIATMSGMFGALVTDQYILPSEAPTAPNSATQEPATNPATSQMYQLVQMADKLAVPFTDVDIFPFVSYNIMMKFRGKEYDQNDPTTDQIFPPIDSPDAKKVEVNGFIQSQIPTAEVNPFLINQEYQPTFEATAGHLSLFRMLCISAQYLCGFEVKDAFGKPVPFYVTASDGITHTSPEFYDTTPVNNAAATLAVASNMIKIGELLKVPMIAKRNAKNGKPLFVGTKPSTPLIEKVQKLQPQSKAYLQLGGGMRQDIIVQFPMAGTYTISQSGYPGYNPPQVLATVQVNASAYCGTRWSACRPKDLSTWMFGDAAKDVIAVMKRPVDQHLGLDFKQQLNRSRIPWVQWGMADRQALAFQPYNIHHTDMEATGGTCSIWTVRSTDVIFHPFHIHVNPFLVLDVKMDPTFNSSLYSAASLAQELLTASAFYQNDKLSGHWRDTVMVPPMGSVTLKQCFDAGPASDNIGTQTKRFAGKFVFHCHFLTHSDTGLLHNIMLTAGAPIEPKTKGTVSEPWSIPGDTRQCPSTDPCGLSLARGCVRCPRGARVTACTCQIVGSFSQMQKLLQGKYTSTDGAAVVPSGSGVSFAAAGAFAAVAAAVSSLLAAAVARRGPRPTVFVQSEAVDEEAATAAETFPME